MGFQLDQIVKVKYNSKTCSGPIKEIQEEKIRVKAKCFGLIWVSKTDVIK
jgi:hypothetical protein